MLNSNTGALVDLYNINPATTTTKTKSSVNKLFKKELTTFTATNSSIVSKIKSRM